MDELNQAPTEMSCSFSKELVSLLSSVVTEICDDSDDEDLLPFEAVASKIIRKAKKSKLHKSTKEKIRGHKNTGLRSPEKPSLENRMGYLIKSRFESITYLNHPPFLVTEELCKETLQITNACACKVHMKPQKQYENISIFGGKEFKGKFKMEPSTAQYVYNLVKSEINEDFKLTPKSFLAVIHSWTQGASLDESESLFGIQKEEFVVQEREIMEVLLKKRFLFERWPYGEGAEHTNRQFKAIARLPRVVGALACVHFPCQVYVPFAKAHKNTNGSNTVAMLLVSNHRGSFIYSSYFWWPGSNTEEEIYRQSSLVDYPIADDSYLVGGRALSTIKQVLAPYSAPKNAKEQIFNAHHKKALDTFRETFHRLMNRFNALFKLNSNCPWRLRKKINSFLVLHNICVDLDDKIPHAHLNLDAFFPHPMFPNMEDAERNLREQCAFQLKATAT